MEFNINDFITLFNQLVERIDKMQAWRFISILVLIAVCFLIWQAPQIITALK